MMKIRWTLIAIAVGMAGSAAWSRDVDYDFVVCTHGRSTVLDPGPDVVALGSELWGIVASSTTKEFEKATTHCLGYMRIIGGKPVGKGVCKWANPAGDTAVGEYEYPEVGENNWKFLGGTGAWKGVSSKVAKFASLGNGKPIEPGTWQGCRRDWGTYTVP